MMQTKLDKLDALLTRTATPNEDAELFADMLLLRNDGRYPGNSIFPRRSAETERWKRSRSRSRRSHAQTRC